MFNMISISPTLPAQGARADNPLSQNSSTITQPQIGPTHRGSEQIPNLRKKFSKDKISIRMDCNTVTYSDQQQQHNETIQTINAKDDIYNQTLSAFQDDL